jgi:hypothetical protein
MVRIQTATVNIHPFFESFDLSSKIPAIGRNLTVIFKSIVDYPTNDHGHRFIFESFPVELLAASVYPMHPSRQAASANVHVASSQHVEGMRLGSQASRRQ